MTAIALLAGLLAVVGARPAPAGAVTGVTSGGSILYMQDGNVWLTSPDGATKRQVTTDGTPASPYQNPSQTDDGTVIMAAKNLLDGVDERNQSYTRGHVYLMTRSGQLIRTFVPEQIPRKYSESSCIAGVFYQPGGINYAYLSPDGAHIVYQMDGNVPVGCSFPDVHSIRIVQADNAGLVSVATSAGDILFEHPNWSGSSRILFHHYPSDYYYDLGGTAQKWFEEGSAEDVVRVPVLKGNRLATVGFSAPNGTPTLRLWTGSPPTAPIPRCDITGQSPGTPAVDSVRFRNPRWARTRPPWRGRRTSSTVPSVMKAPPSTSARSATSRGGAGR